MREVCFILVQDKLLRAYFGSATRIPDERERWEIIWQHRDEITEIAHSHPGEFLDFSQEDLTTMEAVEAGTGKVFTWSVATQGGFLSRRDGQAYQREDSPWWLELMRKLSYDSPRPPAARARQRGDSHRPRPSDGRGIKGEGRVEWRESRGERRSRNKPSK
jgi:hypothetical protein